MVAGRKLVVCHGGRAPKRFGVSLTARFGISYLTLFGFSSENWKRPEREIEDLMLLLRLYLRSEIAEMHEQYSVSDDRRPQRAAEIGGRTDRPRRIENDR